MSVHLLVKPFLSALIVSYPVSTWPDSVLSLPPSCLIRLALLGSPRAVRLTGPVSPLQLPADRGGPEDHHGARLWSAGRPGRQADRGQRLGHGQIAGGAGRHHGHFRQGTSVRVCALCLPPSVRQWMDVCHPEH